jgi:hypothetical protein
MKHSLFISGMGGKLSLGVGDGRFGVTANRDTSLLQSGSKVN